jgi:hypothetical protein
MGVKEWSRFEKISAALVCFSIAVSLAATYLQSLQPEPNGAIQDVAIDGFFAALCILAILLVQKVSVTGAVLAVAIGAFCFYLSEAFPSLKRYPFVGLFVILAVIRQREELKKFDGMAGKLFFVALGYLYGLVIRAARRVRQAFSLGVSAALQDKSGLDRKDDSNEMP